MNQTIKPGIQKIDVENFLSFRKISINLERLNVLVGPNGAGKTNLLNLIKFLAMTARLDLVPTIERFGGFDRLFFRGQSTGRNISIAVEAVLTKHATKKAPDSYKLSFGRTKLRSRELSFLQRQEEFLFKRLSGPGRRIKLQGRKVNVYREGRRDAERRLIVDATAAGLSTLRKLGEDYDASQVNELASLFETFRVIEVDVDAARQLSAHEEVSSLDARARHLAPYLVHLSNSFPDVFELFQEDVRYTVPGLVRIHMAKVGGASEGVAVELEEIGLAGRTPLSQASFGTIRALALFAMLHDPKPPRLTCVEEIDHGLHPHALDRLVDRLRDASQKTQIIVATHSPALVNRLEPSELIVFEKDMETGSTRIPKIAPDEIKAMEERSGLSLGELWFSGIIGGSLDA